MPPETIVATSGRRAPRARAVPVPRAFRRRPLSALLVIAVLSLGSAAAITLFSLVSAVFLVPLPYPEPDRLVRLHENHAEIPARRVSYPNFLDWRSMSTSFDSMSTYRDVRSTFSTGEQALAVDARQVTAAYLDVLGIEPLLGRGFTADEDVYGAPLVAIVSHALWQTELGGSAAVIGTSVLVDGAAHTLVGVLPPAPAAPQDPDVLVLAGQRAAPGSGWTQRDNRMAGYVLARLGSGVIVEQATADMQRVGRDLAREHAPNADHTIEVVPLREALYGDLRLPVLVGLGAVGVLLAIACINASTLLLVSATVRRAEFALRAALGAGARQVALQVLAESMLLAVIGGALGAAIAAAATKLLASGLPRTVLNGAEPAVGVPAVLFSVGLMALLGVLTGMPPALRAVSAGVGEAIGAGARSTSGGGRTREALAVLQIALALTLLVCALLLAESMSRLQRFDYGFDPDGVLTFRVVVDAAQGGAADLVPIHARLLEALEALPGVRSAAIAQELPGFDPRWQSDINPESEIAARRARGELINVDWAIVSGAYFETLGIRIESGRAITEQEAADGAPVMVIDDSLARRFWPDGNALGRHIRYDGPEPVRIVGIARNVRAFGTQEPGRIKIYTPYGRFPLRDVAVMVRADGPNPSALVPAIRAALPTVDARIAMYEAATLSDKLEEHVTPRRLTTSLLVLFAVLASTLAAFGIYAVVGYAMVQRRRELTIRLALGATRTRTVLLVLRKGLALAASGIALGLVAASVATRALSSLLFDVTPASATAYLVSAGTFAGIAVLASLIPASRVHRIAPALALQTD